LVQVRVQVPIQVLARLDGKFRRRARDPEVVRHHRQAGREIAVEGQDSAARGRAAAARDQQARGPATGRQRHGSSKGAVAEEWASHRDRCPEVRRAGHPVKIRDGKDGRGFLRRIAAGSRRGERGTSRRRVGCNRIRRVRLLRMREEEEAGGEPRRARATTADRRSIWDSQSCVSGAGRLVAKPGRGAVIAAAAPEDADRKAGDQIPGTTHRGDGKDLVVRLAENGVAAAACA
jgi:hypothetical protein